MLIVWHHSARGSSLWPPRKTCTFERYTMGSSSWQAIPELDACPSNNLLSAIPRRQCLLWSAFALLCVGHELSTGNHEDLPGWDATLEVCPHLNVHRGQSWVNSFLPVSRRCRLRLVAVQICSNKLTSMWPSTPFQFPRIYNSRVEEVTQS